MSFSWKGYVDLAHELAAKASDPPDEESKLRSSISRSYYGAFCSARNLLRDKDGDTTIPASGSAHDYVRKAFVTSPKLNRQQIGSWLDTLWKARKKADYRDTVAGLASTAELSLIQATKVIVGIAKD